MLLTRTTIKVRVRLSIATINNHDDEGHVNNNTNNSNNKGDGPITNNKWRVGFVTELAIIQRHVSTLAAKLGHVQHSHSGSGSDRKKSLIVVMGDASFQIAANVDVSVQFILEQVCRYWDLDPSRFALQDADGRVWPLSALTTDIMDERIILRQGPLLLLYLVAFSTNKPKSNSPSCK